MFDNKTKSIIDAVNKVLGVNEDIDPNKRTKDTLKGANEPTKQKDDVGPGSDGKSTKVKYRPGPLPTSEGFKDRLFKSLDEANEEMLSRYMKSRGYNPETTTKDKKIAITKSNEFKKWLNDHQFEEMQYDSEDYSEEQLDEMINEVLGKDASAGDWISDFVHSDNPKFKGKSKDKRKKMALAAYYAHQREEVELDEEKYGFFGTKNPKIGDRVTHKPTGATGTIKTISTQDNRTHINFKSDNDAGHIKKGEMVNTHMGSHVKVHKEEVELEEPTIEEASQPKSDKEKKLASLAHPKNKVTFKDVLVGRGVLKKEETELEEAKRPETDSDVPWVGGSEPAQPDVKDKGTSGTHTPMSRAKHLARVALKKVKKEVVGEETEQVEEGAFSSGALKLTPQGKKKFDALHKSMKSTSTVRDKDEKGTYTAVRVKNAGESDYKEISRKYDKE